LLGSGQNPPAPNPIRSACICKCSAQAAQTLAPDKPTKHFTAYDLVAKTIKPIIDAFQHLYNRHRPNGTVGGLAPAQYLAPRIPRFSKVHLTYHFRSASLEYHLRDIPV
jgi:hypothetical protein